MRGFSRKIERQRGGKITKIRGGGGVRQRKVAEGQSGGRGVGNEKELQEEKKGAASKKRKTSAREVLKQEGRGET